MLRRIVAFGAAALLAFAPTQAGAAIKTLAITAPGASATPTSALTIDTGGSGSSTGANDIAITAATFNNSLTALPIGTFIYGTGVAANTYIDAACTGGPLPTVLHCHTAVAQGAHTAITANSLYGYQLPADFTSTNQFICLGAGGDGTTNGAAGAGGGGSGVWTEVDNVSLAANSYHPYKVGIHGQAITSTGDASTWFNNTSALGTQTSGTCGARGGGTGSTATAGAGGSLTSSTPSVVGPLAIAGSAGGAGGSGTRGGGGGAGAPGPDGAGVVGGAGSTGTFAGTGGNADANSVNNTANLGGATAGTAGGNGTYYTLTAGGTVGFGGGGAGGDKSGTVNGFSAGLYGAGGGGAGPGGTAGAGANGFIVIIYNTTPPASVCTLGLMRYGKC